MVNQSASNPTEPVTEYRCPGEDRPISRAVHLGRLARFYPACRQCPFREDTGSLSPRHVRRLAETRHRAERHSPLFDEGAAGVYLNELGPDEVRRMAAALGVLLRTDAETSVAFRSAKEAVSHASSPVAPPDHATFAERKATVVVIAGDGRPLAAELVAAAAEGLRWAGCGVVDVGQATSPCVASAIARLEAAGGVLVGNPSARPEIVGLKFWGREARPLSAGGPLERLRRLFEAGIDRPARRFGPLRRWQAQGPYLADLSGYYHALRPLRLVLRGACPPALGYLEKLTAEVACEVVPCPAPADRLREEVRRRGAHLGVILGDDGETAGVVDELGRRVGHERLLVLVAGHLLAERPGGVVVLEEAASPGVAGQIAALGARVETSECSRAAMDRAMRRHEALLGGGPSGRTWHRVGEGPPLPDGLRTISLLLRILSRSDRGLSVVLDGAGGGD